MAATPSLTADQRVALTEVRNGAVSYMHFPFGRGATPYFLVEKKRARATRTYRSLMNKGLVRAERPSLRATPLVLTPAGEQAMEVAA